MVIVTCCDRGNNWADEFMGVWDDMDQAQAWVYENLLIKHVDYVTHLENDVSYMGSHSTYCQTTLVPKDGGPMISFIQPNQ
jgi:hypothetical protein